MKLAAAVIALTFGLAAVAYLINGDTELFMLGIIAAGTWLIVSYLSPPRRVKHKHTWDWTPHPVTGLSATTCTTCGEKAVFNARR